jgi:hypothetical protein
MARNQHIRCSRGSLSALREIVVVVPAHDERDRLPRCLDGVAAAAELVDVPVTVWWCWTRALINPRT